MITAIDKGDCNKNDCIDKKDLVPLITVRLITLRSLSLTTNFEQVQA